MLSVFTPPHVAFSLVGRYLRDTSEESQLTQREGLSDPSKGLSHLPIATDIPLRSLRGFLRFVSRSLRASAVTTKWGRRGEGLDKSSYF